MEKNITPTLYFNSFVREETFEHHELKTLILCVNFYSSRSHVSNSFVHVSKMASSFKIRNRGSPIFDEAIQSSRQNLYAVRLIGIYICVVPHIYVSHINSLDLKTDVITMMCRKMMHDYAINCRKNMKN